MIIRTVIADDEPLARVAISEALRGEPDVQVIAEAANGPETLQIVRGMRPDLLFLDIKMPGADGFEVLGRLRPVQVPVVVFVTAYDCHALRAFDVHARDYLLKPFTRLRLRETIDLARRQLVASSRALQDPAHPEQRSRPGIPEKSAEIVDPARLAVKHRGRTVLLDLNEVDWVKSEGNYITLHVANNQFTIRSTLSQLLAHLDPRMFVRIHRSAIVNVRRVVELKPRGHCDYQAVLASGFNLKLSRHYRAILFSVLRTARRS
jgi:two-component system, LytTR family, response regulator